MTTSDKGKEDALPQGHDRFRLLFESVADALFLHDLEGRLVEVNQAACASLGYTREVLLNLPFASIVKQVQPESLRDLWARVIKGEKLTAQGFHQRRDGATFPVEVHLSPFEYEGRPYILASARDLTERREAEKVIKALRTSESFLYSIIDQSPYPMWISDDQGTLIKLNQSCQDLLHITPLEVVGKYNVFQDNIVEQQGLLPLLQRVFAQGETVRFEIIYDTALLTALPIKTPTLVILDVTVSPILDDHGKVTNAVFQHVDITHRKQTQAALAESEQRFSTFMDHLPAAVFIKDQGGRLVFANRYLREIFGWGDCLGKTTNELFPREVAEQMIEDDQRVLTTGPVAIQERILDVQGAEHFFDTYKFPIMTEGSSVLLGGIAVDATERHRAEEALRKEKLFTEAILDSLPGTFFLLDSQGRQLGANRSGIKVTGYSWEELTNMQALDSIAGEDRPAAQRAMAEVLEKGEVSLEAQILTKDGRKIPFLFTAKRFIIDDMPHILGTGLDITARKLAEQELSESEERYRSLFQNNHAVMLLVDPEAGYIMDANPAACAYYGFSKEELLAKKTTDLNTLPQEQVLRAMQSAKAEERKLFEFRHRLAGGEVRDVEVFSGPIRIKGQDFLYSIVHDVTARKEAEKALQESEARFRQVVESSPLPIGLANADGTIAYVNPKFVETFKYTLEDVPRLADWYHRAYPDPAYRQRVIAQWEKALEKINHEGGTTENIEVEITCNDGSKRIMEIFGAQMGTQTLAVFHDLTERKRMEEALREKEKKFRSLYLEFQGILNAVPDILCLLSPDLRIVWGNDATILEIPGGHAADIIGNHCYPLRHERSEPCENCPVVRCFSSGKVETEEVVSFGDIFELRAVPLYDDQGELRGAIEVARKITERKQAEERLLATQERLELALQGADLGTWDWNVETGTILVNKRWAEMLGYTLAEVEPHARFWEELVHPDDLPAVMEILNAHLAGQTPFYETEHRLRHKSGSWVWVLAKGKVIGRDAQGKAVRACGTHLDITERKRAEMALRDSEERLRLALQAANQGLYDLNIQNGEAKVSPEYATMLGYDPGEFQETNDRWIERCHPDDREQVAATFQAYVRGDIPDYEVEFRQRTQAGDWKWILSLGKVVAWDDDGKPLRMLGTHTDITARKKAEEALRESEKRLREAQEMAHLGFWYWNVKTGEVTWSEEVYNIFQLDPKEFTPRIDSILELSPWPGDHERDQELIRKAMESHAKGAYEQRFLLPDKSIGHYYSTFQGKYDDEDNLIFIVGTVLDITARKRAEEERAKFEAQMQEVQKLESLGILAGGIAHDFNNLLMAILGNADLALLALSPASPARPNVEEITRTSLRAADLCRQMLAYSGKGRFVVSRYDLSEIVREMTQMLEVSVSKKAVLRYTFEADLPAVEVDATQMRQVIMNLITNASEALGDRSGYISVSTGVMECDRAYLAESYLDDKLPEGKYVYLEVADTGFGIDEETRRRIFDPFFTTKFTGRGLGLAAVLGIVRGHQGAIKVSSKVGQGTTFKVLLPAREWALGEREPSPVPSVKPVSGGGTILLIDDDLEVRDVGSQMLERLGFKVLTAAHGREGLKVFQECGGAIDCVILDLTMPEMGGEEVFHELRRLRRDVRVILSSGYNEQDVIQRFAGKELAGFIQKPYRVANLQEILNRILG